MRRILAVLIAFIMIASFTPTAVGTAEISNQEYQYVRVKISTNNAATLSFDVSGDYFIDENGARFTDGRLTVSVRNSNVIVTHSTAGELYCGNTVTLLRMNMDRSAGYLRWSERKYLGHMYISAASNGYLQVVNKVPIAHYLYGVLVCEMSNSYPIEALKAQAIAAKSYAISKLRPNADYDLIDTASDQVYRGYVSSATRAIEAVDSTINKVLAVDGNLIMGYYSHSNGGETNIPSYAWNVGTSANAGFDVRLDSYDLLGAASTVESAFVPIGDGLPENAALCSLLISKASTALDVQVLELLSIESFELNTPAYAQCERNMTNVYAKLNVNIAAGGESSGDGAGNRTSREVELNFGAFELLNAGVFTNTVLRIYWGEEVDGGYNIYHARFGHGVGLSQKGAYAMANDSTSYTSILGFYYPTATISDINITMPSNPQPSPITSPTIAPTTAPTPTGTPVTTPSPTEAPIISPPPGYTFISYGEINANGVNFRRGPSTAYQIITVLSREETLYVIEEVDGWYHAVTQSGVEGYVRMDFLSILGSIDNGNGIVARGRITTNGINLRNGPGFSYDVVDVLQRDEVIEILDYTGSWYNVISSDNVEGYVRSIYVEITEYVDDPVPTPTPTPNPTLPVTPLPIISGTGYINANGINFRTGPGLSYDIIGTFSYGDTVGIISEANGWHCVYAMNTVGYVRSLYVDESQTPIVTPTPTLNPSTPQSAVITANGVNFRNGAGTEYDIIDVLYRNDSIIVHSSVGEWYYADHDGVMGYVHSDYVEITGPYVPDYPTGAIALGVTTGSVNMRTGPSTDYERIMTVPSGSEVVIFSEVNGWYEIEYNDIRGYVSGRYVRITQTISNPTPSPDPILVPIGEGVTTDKVYLRTGPGTNYNAITLLSSGVNVTIYGLDNGWYHVDYRGTEGYLYAAYVRMISNNGTITSLRPATGVATGNVNFRTGAGFNYEIIDTIQRNSTLQVLGSHENWYYVVYNNRVGYVSKAYVNITSAGDIAIAQVGKDITSIATRTIDDVNLRTAPSLTDSSIIRCIPRGDAVVVYYVIDGWCLVVHENTWGFTVDYYINL